MAPPRVEPSSDTLGIPHVAATSVDNQSHQGFQWVSLPTLLHSDSSSDYTVFKLKQGCSYFTVYFCLFQTVFSFWRASDMLGPGVPLWVRLSVIARCFIPPLGWLYIYLFRKHDYSDVLGAEGKRIRCLGNASILLQTLCAGSLLLAWTLTRDECRSEACLEDFPERMLPVAVMVYSIAGVIAMPIFYPCHSVSVVLLAVVINYSALLAACFLIGAVASTTFAIGLMGTIVFFLACSYEGSAFSNYTSFSKFEIALRVKVESENKEYLMQIQREEMRHMLGN
jgi:hypothetical protein